MFYTVQGTGDTRGLSEVDSGCFTYRFSEQTSFVADFVSAADIRRLNFICRFIVVPSVTVIL